MLLEDPLKSKYIIKVGSHSDRTLAFQQTYQSALCLSLNCLMPVLFNWGKNYRASGTGSLANV